MPQDPTTLLLEKQSEADEKLRLRPRDRIFHGYPYQAQVCGESRADENHQVALHRALHRWYDLSFKASARADDKKSSKPLRRPRAPQPTSPRTDRVRFGWQIPGRVAPESEGSPSHSGHCDGAPAGKLPHEHGQEQD
jgi:hypothetical protein